MIENPNMACLFRTLSELLNLATTKKQIWSVVRKEAPELEPLDRVTSRPLPTLLCG